MSDSKSDPTPVARQFFGTDGIRGIANVHPMTAEVALSLGRAVAHQAKHGEHRHRIVIGKDTRLSGYMIEMAFASGVCSMGVDALLLGPLPTPAVFQNEMKALFSRVYALACTICASGLVPTENIVVEYNFGARVRLPPPSKCFDSEVRRLD